MIPYHLFEGKRVGEYNEAIVLVDGEPLPQRQDLVNHSPDGFEWGYRGSGPAQLSLAILAFLYGDEFALQHYQFFKEAVIGRLPREEDWIMTSDEIDVRVQRLPKLPV